MAMRVDAPRRRAFRPNCDSLESRNLLTSIPVLPTAPVASISTNPGNGDQNPYGVVVVPKGFPTNGAIRPGDVLVSNFNNGDNVSGTGTTIVDITPNGTQTAFFQSSAAGLTQALGVLKKGYVIVGNIPTPDGTANTLGQGSLQLLDRNGNVVASTPAINGPWGLTINDQGSSAQIFVSNVLTGTITRYNVGFGHRGTVSIGRGVQIASGYTSPAFEVGVNGMAYDASRDLLYVAATGDNAIFAVPNAGRVNRDRGTGRLITNDPVHLHGPNDVILAPNNTLLVSSGDGVNVDPNQPSEIGLFTRGGTFLAQQSISPNVGAPFGMALTTFRRTFTLYAANDNTGTLDIFQGTF